MISVEHLKKTYGEQEVLKDISITFEDGKTYAILGLSGGGKSTLLRCLNGLETPTSGKIMLDSLLLTDPAVDWAAVRQRIGMVFQGFNLFHHMNATENVAFALMKVKHASKAEATSRAIQLLNDVGLSHRINAYPSQLSGGEKQRVAIARTLAMNPEVILFDEPTSALDPEMTIEVLRVIKDLRQKGITMIVVTHELMFAKHVASEIVFMDKGEILEQESSQVFFEHPKTDRAKQFLTPMI